MVVERGSIKGPANTVIEGTWTREQLVGCRVLVNGSVGARIPAGCDTERNDDEIYRRGVAAATDLVRQVHVNKYPRLASLVDSNKLWIL